MGIGFLLIGIGGGLVITTAAVLYRRYMTRKWGWHDITDEQNVKGKIVIITGANEGLGKETAFEMYQRGAIVIMACRNVVAANTAAIAIRCRVKAVPAAGELVPMELDLSSFSSVKTFVQNFKERYDHVNILINNAGVYMAHNKSDRNKTIDGYEIHLQVNHLSHFLLTILLIDLLKKGAPSRVINVASTLYEKAQLSLDDLNLENLEPSEKAKMIPYSNSKLANVLFTRELASRVQGNGIFTYGLCPGWVKTSIFRNADIKWYQYIMILPVAFLFMRTPQQGCQTILHCALSNECGTETGKLYRNCDHWVPSSIVNDVLAKRLFESSEEMVGIKFKI